MNFYKIFLAVITLSVLYGCQSEAPVEISQHQPTITIKAFFPDENETRAHILYGYGDPENRSKEVFVWDEKDELFLYNISRLKEYPIEACCPLESKNGKSAVFKFVPSDCGHATTFGINKGDTILAFFGETTRRCKQDTEGKDIYDKELGGWLYDERKIATIGLGTEGNKPQYIEKNPDHETTLSYMKDNLKMYDIVIAEDDGTIPDLHFKHLSAIMRVTLHNETGHDLYLTKIEFKYPTKSPTAIEGDSIDRNPSFFATTLYCSVETNEIYEQYLKVYETYEFFNGSKPYTENIGTTINGKEGVADSGESIKNGESYELYLSTVPRIGNDSYGDKISLHLIENHDTDNPYEITISNFNRVIEPGKRYWFDLVATPDNKLVLKSKYNPDDYKTSGSSGEENKEENRGDSTPED